MKTNNITYAWKDVKYDWQTRSSCRKKLKFDRVTKKHVPYTADDFYPASGKSVTDQVKRLCDKCPVKDRCLDHALVHEKYGYWGGTTEIQREVIRRKEHIIYRSPQSNAWML
jgi:hypothetical protein